MGNSAPITLAQLWRFKAAPGTAAAARQDAAVTQLEEQLQAGRPYGEVMRRSEPWFATWSQGGQQPEPAAPRATNPLAVPYFPQLDNGPEGWRQCQSSSIAMCAAFLGVAGIRDDLDYLRVVERFGDTTSQDAHRQALASLKAPGRFRQNLGTAELLGELKGGRPVAIGILHHGHVSAPSGGGHYIVVIGWTDSAWICHDPYGELDLVNGGWARQGSGGRSVMYSHRNLNPRWLPQGLQSGWGWVFS